MLRIVVSGIWLMKQNRMKLKPKVKTETGTEPIHKFLTLQQELFFGASNGSITTTITKQKKNTTQNNYNIRKYNTYYIYNNVHIASKLYLNKTTPNTYSKTIFPGIAIPVPFK